MSQKSTEKDKSYTRAIVKFNGGRGALLCNRCRMIIAYGFEHEDKAHFCDEHRNLTAMRKSYTLSSVDTTEEAILSEDWPNSSEPATGWRRFRINYNNEMGFSNIEGTIYFPPDVDPYPILDEICDRINNTHRRDN